MKVPILVLSLRKVTVLKKTFFSCLFGLEGGAFVVVVVVFGMFYNQQWLC